MPIEKETWKENKASIPDYTNTKLMCKYIHKLKHWVLITIISGAVLFIVCYVVLTYIAVLCEFPDSYVKMFISLAAFMSFSTSNLLYLNCCICYTTKFFPPSKKFFFFNNFNTKKYKKIQYRYDDMLSK